MVCAYKKEQNSCSHVGEPGTHCSVKQAGHTRVQWCITAFRSRQVYRDGDQNRGTGQRQTGEFGLMKKKSWI